MTPCSATRRNILELPDPVEATGRDRAHVEACPACRAWWAKLETLEFALARLPSPAVDPARRERCVAELPRPGVTVPAAEAEEPARWLDVVGRWLPASALGLALMLGFLAVVEIRDRRPVATVAAGDPLMDKLVAVNTRLSRAEGSMQTADALQEMAEAYRESALALARVDPNGEALGDSAKGYSRVVREGLLTHVDRLDPRDPDGEGHQLLAKLREAKRDTEEFAREVPPASVEPLREIARAADTAAIRLAARLGAK